MRLIISILTVISFLIAINWDTIQSQGWIGSGGGGGSGAFSDSSRSASEADSAKKVPIATATDRGGVIVGSGINVTPGGVISAAGVGGAATTDSIKIDGVSVSGDSIPQEAKVIQWVADTSGAIRAALDTGTTATETRVIIKDSLGNHYKKTDIIAILAESTDVVRSNLDTATTATETRAIIKDSLGNHYKKTDIIAILAESTNVVRSDLDTATTATETRAILTDSLGNHYKKTDIVSILSDTSNAIRADLDTGTTATETRAILQESLQVAKAELDTGITRVTVYDSTRHLLPDSITFRRTFLREVNFGTWVTDWELDASVLDTLRVAARRCTVAGRLASAYRATYPDTGKIQTIHASSGILYLPTGQPKLDSITFFIRTLNTHVDSGSVAIRVWKYDANLARTYVDSTVALVSSTANTWKFDISLTTLGLLGRYTPYEIEAVFRVKGTRNSTFNWSEIGRMRECFSY